MGIKEEIEKLRKEIRYYDYKYYSEAQPEISDYEYDQLLNELKELEVEYPELITPDSPTQRVAGFVQKGFSQIRHKTPMRSLDNTYSFEELDEFIERVRRTLKREVEWVVELKIEARVSLWSMKTEYLRGVRQGVMVG